jgi:hypothetical protein
MDGDAARPPSPANAASAKPTTKIAERSLKSLMKSASGAENPKN